MRFEIVWPEHRWVSADQINTWFSDAVVNGKLSEEYASDPQFNDVESKALELHDLGDITLGRGRR